MAQQSGGLQPTVGSNVSGQGTQVLQTSGPRRLPSRRWWLLLALFGLVFVFWIPVAPYMLPIFKDTFVQGPLEITLSSQMFLSANEEDELQYHITNTQPVTESTAAYWLDNQGPYAVFGLDIYTGTVGERPADGVVKMKVAANISDIDPVRNMLGNPIGLSLWGYSMHPPGQKVSDLPISVAPIPLARTYSQLGLTMLGAIFLFALRELWATLNPRASQANT